ncbi:adenylate/guanylate cyclase domain-containing protein [Calothrix sp. UHCC 0171]|uniref:adenylate/guanylate cyclase domain-containing protein n=1 Tax=Calothrix sp. UHCC 0171 TaxID=3110245 RepID=UPI002B1F373D|nr:adenylate/guanylate cyclase domain-containing protein [Calothrix sp. UHCC 0171]MEA5570806.1 adenylate/guanylate cyclase domain-containing protein [Calothrix sp. UHCC 0171]
MKYQVLDRIFNKHHTSRKFERLEIDANLQIIDTSEQVERFADNPMEVMLGKDIRLGFPEFIGLEDVLISILEGNQDLFELEGIRRCLDNKDDLYIDIYILRETSHEEKENRLIILLEDVTDMMLLKQRISQKSHETNLLSSVLGSYKNYMDKVITSMADALIVTTKSGEIKKVNRATLELFGYSEEELINQSISIIIDDNQLLQKAIQKYTVFHKYFQNAEVVCRTKTKEKVLVAFSCSVIPKKIEGLEDIVYIGRDVTTRKRRQQRHSAQYTITRILSESTSIKLAMPEILRIICESLGWDLGELWTSHEYIPKSTLQNHSYPVLRCVEMWSSRTVSVREFKLVTWKTIYRAGMGLPGRIWTMGTPIWVRDVTNDVDERSQFAVKAGLNAAFGFPILDDRHTFGVMTFFSREVQPPDIELLQMMVSIGSQIAEFIKRKHAEEALLESEERYRDLFENANDLIQSVNTYGEIIYVNRAWRETLGYSEHDIANMNIFDIIPSDYQKHCRQIFSRVIAGKNFESLQTAFFTKNGDKIILEGNINCKFADGKPVATRGIFRNITHRISVENALREQQEQTERLLLNILPETIANRLKIQPGNIAEDFANVSVLFADIVGFTEISSQLGAIQLVQLLNKIFSAFDRLCDRYGLEKIKTIGDAYMVVGGLPNRSSNHAQAIANMAIEMQNAIACFNMENQQNFNIRIGIHSGPVVAGVIGIKKFTYDLWGDTVNIASRMESHGLVGQIQVSEDTYNLLADEFTWEKRGEIEVKGKGTMTTYLLKGRVASGEKGE